MKMINGLALAVLLSLGSVYAQMTVENSSGTELMRVTGEGNVGIGTSDPSAQLHTTGAVRFQGFSGTGTRTVGVDADGTLTTTGVQQFVYRKMHLFSENLNIPLSPTGDYLKVWTVDALDGILPSDASYAIIHFSMDANFMTANNGNFFWYCYGHETAESYVNNDVACWFNTNLDTNNLTSIGTVIVPLDTNNKFKVTLRYRGDATVTQNDVSIVGILQGYYRN